MLWLNSARMVKIKQNNFIDAVPIMPRQNPLWIVGLKIYGEGRTQIPLRSPSTLGHIARMQGRQGLY